METTTSKTQLWIGRIMSILVILFLLFDSIVKFIKIQPVIDTTVNVLGYKEHHIFIIGLVSFIPTILYIIPRTSVFGALLLTAHFGGAIASNFRVDSPLFTHTIFPVYLAILMWGGLWLRNEKLRAIIPLNKD